MEITKDVPHRFSILYIDAPYTKFNSNLSRFTIRDVKSLEIILFKNGKSFESLLFGRTLVGKLIINILSQTKTTINPHTICNTVKSSIIYVFNT